MARQSANSDVDESLEKLLTRSAGNCHGTGFFISINGKVARCFARPIFRAWWSSIAMVSDSRADLTTLGLSSPMALEGFLEAAPDAIVIVDRAGDIVIVNRLAER